MDTVLKGWISQRPCIVYHQSASTCVCYKNKSKKLKVHKWYLLKVENWFNCYFEKYWVFTN